MKRGGLALSAWLALGCGREAPPAFSYFDARIAPVLEVGCQQQTTGCHVTTDTGVASGNLDLSSFDALMRRADVLPASGPYAVGALLLKGGDPIRVAVETFDPPDPSQPDQRFVAITTDVRHAGAQTLREGSDGYARLKSWIAQGYARDGSLTETLRVSEGPCREGVGEAPGFDPRAVPADAASFARFVSEVQPILVGRCAGASCHGTPAADLYLSCGRSEAEQRWNYFVSVAHVDRTPALSELLRRPLAKQRGGTFHEGGSVIAGTDDPDYARIRAWIDDLATRAPALIDAPPDDPGLRFFGNYVQPVLVKKGCLFQNCHGPAMGHDLRLRGGSQGVFSRIATQRNHDMTRRLLSLESADPNESRVIAKNLFVPGRGGRGLAHRGGALLEDFAEPARADACAGRDVTREPLDTLPAYCVLVAWHARERALAVERGEVSEDGVLPLVYVSRPLGVGDPRDFDTYRPGADLLRATLTLHGDEPPTLASGTSLLGACGLAPAATDVRGVAASWDGTRIAFGARAAESEPLRLFEVRVDGTGCARIADVAPAASTLDGILTHDFDPAYAPDDTLVFASARGNLVHGEGPTRTPSQLAPNANLYARDPRTRAVRQLSFLSNQEVQPSFMADGRLVYTVEKRAPELFQLAGRRQNLDGGDYHPLFAQRASVGFARATEIVELADHGFALVAGSADAADGAGAIAIVNRSLGPDQDDRDPADALYLHALSLAGPSALDGGEGACRSPAALPSRWLIASCDPRARTLSAGGFDFDLHALDPKTGRSVRLGGASGRAEVESVVVIPRVQAGVFRSRIDEVNGRSELVEGTRDAEVHVLDGPLLATLLFANTRTGRPIDARVAALEVLESTPPPAGARSFAALPAAQVVRDAFGEVYVASRSLGTVPLLADGSAKLRVPGGRPLSLRLRDASGAPLTFAPGGPFTGVQTQREELQFHPGERTTQGFRRDLFDGLCGSCHGSVSGREVDVAVDVDVLTRASATLAKERLPSVLTK
ncbi:MAG: hypothetical protein ABW252_01265 [Polyangiales bacterium]